jgi:putative transposase
MPENKWARLAAENRILCAHPPARIRLSDPERSTHAEIGKRLGRTHGSKLRTSPGRPRIPSALEAIIVRFARENSGWGYDRIVEALANLGHLVSDQTVGNILRRYGIQPAPKRSQNTT